MKLNGGDGVRCIGVQTHYDNPGLTAGLVDSSGPVFHMTAENTVRPTELGVVQINDPEVSLYGQDIVSGWSKYSFDCSGLGGIGDPGITFFSVGHHMHVAGHMMQTNITRSGIDDVVWTTEHYDFNFQTNIPVNVTIKGTATTLSLCHFARDSRPHATPHAVWHTLLRDHADCMLIGACESDVLANSRLQAARTRTSPATAPLTARSAHNTRTRRHLASGARARATRCA